MKSVNVGVIGCGAPHAESSHLPQLASFSDVSLEAFCDLDQRKLGLALDKYPAKRGFTDYRKMIEEVPLDAVFVIVRPSRLKDIVLDCFDRGLAVSVEKAPGISPGETKAMLQAARRHHCLHMVGFDRRYAPVVLRAAEILRNTGTPRQVAGRFHRQYVAPINPFDAYIHGLDLMRFLGGDLEGFLMNPHFSGEVMDGCDLLLNYGTGAAGNLSLVSCAEVAVETYEVHAGRTFLRIDVPEGRLQVVAEGKETVQTTADLCASPIQGTKGYWENRHFIDCVATGRTPAPNLEDSLKTMQFAQDIADRSRAPLSKERARKDGHSPGTCSGRG